MDIVSVFALIALCTALTILIFAGAAFIAIGCKILIKEWRNL